MKKLCNSTVYYLVAKVCKKLHSGNSGRFRYEMIVESLSEMQLLEVVAVIYPFYFFNAASLDFMCSSESSLKKPCLVLNDVDVGPAETSERQFHICYSYLTVVLSIL